MEFIEELINSQILVSELNPSVTGEYFFNRIISILEDSKESTILVSNLKDIQLVINQLDFPNINQKDHIRLYKAIEKN